MASDKNRPPDNDLPPVLHEQVAVKQEQDSDSTIHQTQFSTHPPPDREMISGSFRLSLAGDQQLQKVYALFEKRPELQKEITNPNFGGMFLREFHLFNKLPNRVKINIQGALLKYLQEKIKCYEVDNKKKNQLPNPSQINQEIVRQVLERNQLQTVKDETEKLLAFQHEVDDEAAENILHTMIQWFEHYEVQLYAQSSETNTGIMKVELHRLLIRLKTRRVINSRLNAPHSPSSIPPSEPKKEEKDRS